MGHVREWLDTHNLHHDPLREWHRQETTRHVEENAAQKADIASRKAATLKSKNGSNEARRRDKYTASRSRHTADGKAVEEDEVGVNGTSDAPDDKANELWSELDTDGDGDVSFEEFEKGMQEKLGSLCPKGKALKQVYETFLDHHGRPSRSSEPEPESKRGRVARLKREKVKDQTRKKAELSRTKSAIKMRNSAAPLSPKSEAAFAAETLEAFLTAADCADYLGNLNEMGVKLIEHLEDMDPDDFDDVGIKKIERKRLRRLLNERRMA